MKIVSLVPSLTELLCDLGVEVVGRTKFCIHPQEQVRSIAKVGGTKTVSLEKVLALQPDLVIANKEENVADQVKAIEAQGIEVLVTDIKDKSSAMTAIVAIGRAVGREVAARSLVDRIALVFEEIPSSRYTVCYLIWRKPYMTVGRDTYIHDMLVHCGLTNVYIDETRYPTVTEEELVARDPDLVMLSSEPFPFADKHIGELKVLLPQAKIILVDGEYFSWYGSRMVAAAKYFKELVTNL